MRYLGVLDEGDIYGEEPIAGAARTAGNEHSAGAEGRKWKGNHSHRR